MDWPALDRRGTRVLRLAGVGLLAVAASIAAVSLLLPLALRLFARAIELTMKACVWVARSLSVGMSLWSMARVVVRNERLANFLEGEPTLLVRDGKILDGALAREGIRRAELEAAIREHGFKDIGDCRAAILEIDGSISVVGMEDPVHVRQLPPLHHHHRKAGRRGFKPGQ